MAFQTNHNRRFEITYVKAGHTFIFRGNANGRDSNATMRQLAEFATDSEVDFDWQDAATVARKLKAANVQ